MLGILRHLSAEPDIEYATVAISARGRHQGDRYILPNVKAATQNLRVPCLPTPFVYPSREIGQWTVSLSRSRRMEAAILPQICPQ